jgi:hypothetical protein
VVAHALSGELPKLGKASIGVQLDSLALFLMTIAGVVGWKWEGMGGLFALSGYAIWQAVERRVPWPPGIIEIALLFGLLYVAAWLCRRTPALTRQGAAAH